MRRMTLTVALTASVMAITACNRERPCPAPSPPPSLPTAQLPTATEVFHLRNECVQLGENILNANTIGSALTQDVLSNYDPKDNRCYVDLAVSLADLTVPMDSQSYYSSSGLYDGQTKELLANIQVKNGKKTGIVFKGNTQVTGFDAVAEYIDGMMGH